jgi:hypothetical protein
MLFQIEEEGILVTATPLESELPDPLFCFGLAFLA